MESGSDSRPPITLVAHTLVWSLGGRELLLLERANTGVFDGYFSLPGGRVNHGERIAAAAARELKEEADLHAADLCATCVLPFKGGVNFIFSCWDWHGEASNMEPTLCAGIGWYPVDKLPSKIVPWLSKVVEMQGTDLWYDDLT